jgi:uncharacterized protein YigA (DUF484 family)
VTLQPGITEQEIANYLANTPAFFERHAELLASVQLTSPHGQRAVSLQERQMEMLRERIKAQEQRAVEMIRHGNENLAIADRLHRFTCELLRVDTPDTLPEVVVRAARHQFMIPQATLRLWGVRAELATRAYAQDVSDDLRAFVTSMGQPYCGVNAGFEAVGWLAEPTQVASVAMVPLRQRGAESSFGLLVLASPDATRYTADMGTEFLQRLGEACGSALGRLLPPAAA